MGLFYLISMRAERDDYLHTLTSHGQEVYSGIAENEDAFAGQLYEALFDADTIVVVGGLACRPYVKPSLVLDALHVVSDETPEIFNLRIYGGVCGAQIRCGRQNVFLVPDDGRLHEIHRLFIEPCLSGRDASAETECDAFADEILTLFHEIDLEEEAKSLGPPDLSRTQKWAIPLVLASYQSQRWARFLRAKTELVKAWEGNPFKRVVAAVFSAVF